MMFSPASWAVAMTVQIPAAVPAVPGLWEPPAFFLVTTGVLIVRSARLLSLSGTRHNDNMGYSLNRSCPAQRVGLGRSDLAELNQRPGPMTFSYRSCSTYVNSPDDNYPDAVVMPMFVVGGGSAAGQGGALAA